MRPIADGEPRDCEPTRDVHAVSIVLVGNGLRRGASLALFTKFYHQAENDGSKLVYSVEIVEGMGRGNQA